MSTIARQYERLSSTVRRFSGRERRQHPRFDDIDLDLVIDGQRIETEDWSLGGFRIKELPSDYGVHGTVGGKLYVEEEDKEASFTAEILRRLENGAYACRFVEISTAAFFVMSQLARN